MHLGSDYQSECSVVSEDLGDRYRELASHGVASMMEVGGGGRLSHGNPLEAAGALARATTTG